MQNNSFIFQGPKAASRLSMKFKNDHASITKEYLALVDGEFPSNGEVRVDVPLSGHLINHKGAENVYPSPKESVTIFERLEYNGSCSLVRCKLLTGRTHQIRFEKLCVLEGNQRLFNYYFLGCI